MGGAHGRKGDVGGCDEVGTVAEIIPVVCKEERNEKVSAAGGGQRWRLVGWLVVKSAYEKCAKEPSYVM